MSGENYQSWVERVVGGRDAKPLAEGEVVKSSSGEPFGAIQFLKLQKEGFVAEVGKKGDQYIYHFYPEEKYLGALIYQFYEPMSNAFIELFKRPEQVEAVWEEDMKAYAVRVLGYVNTIWGDELALRVIDIVEANIAKRNQE